MALNGIPANLGPEARAWAIEVERELADLRKQLELALGQIRGTR